MLSAKIKLKFKQLVLIHGFRIFKYNLAVPKALKALKTIKSFRKKLFLCFLFERAGGKGFTCHHFISQLKYSIRIVVESVEHCLNYVALSITRFNDTFRKEKIKFYDEQDKQTKSLMFF